MLVGSLPASLHDPTRLPLYETLKTAMECPRSFLEGVFSFEICCCVGRAMGLQDTSHVQHLRSWPALLNRLMSAH